MNRQQLVLGLVGIYAGSFTFVATYGNELYESAVVHYQFEALGANGEVMDSNANQVHLIASGGAASLVTGAEGNGLRLPDGVVLTTTATGSDDSVLNITRGTPFTVASWVKLENVGDRFYLASKYRRDVGGPLELRGWSFSVDAGGVLDGIWRIDQALGVAGRIQIRTTTGIADTDWHHIAMTIDYDEADATRGVRMYIDGALQPMSASATGLAGVDDVDLSHDWPFVISGRYDTQLNEGGSADDLAVWKTSLTAGEIASLVPSSMLPGDFNGDDVVDAADYTVWRDGLGTSYTQTDYDTWKSNFGMTAGAGAGEGNASLAPEPSSFLLLGFVALLALATYPPSHRCSK